MPGAPIPDTPIPDGVLRLAEAFVFASPQPVTPAALQPLLPVALEAGAVLDALQARCAGRGVVLAQAGGWAFRTAPDLAAALAAVLAPPRRLPRACMEVLAAVALHQPVTRAELASVRGAALSQATMDLLLEAGLVRPAGRRDAPGRPVLWATTPRFLEQFGLRSLRDLPDLQPDRQDVPPPAPGAGP